MNAKKVFGYIAAMLMLLPMMLGAFGSQMTAHADDPPADPTTADVTLHKVVFEDELPSNLIQNTGEEMDDFENLGGEPLEGATFVVYDVTEQYYAYIEGPPAMTPEAALGRIETDAMHGAPSYGTQVGSEQVTDADGKVVFAGLPLEKTIGETGNTRTVDSVYLFIETDAPADIKQRAMPIALAMPIYKLDAKGEPTDELNTDIHLYPKNVSKDDTKDITGDFEVLDINGVPHYNVEIGAEIPYRITLTLPEYLEDLDSFTLTDTPSAGLVFINDTLTITSGSVTLVAGTDYTLTPAANDRGFTIVFNLTSETLLDLAGEEIYVDYKMKLTEDIDPEDIFDNTATLKVDNQTDEIPGPPVVTGGHRFVKTNAHTGEELKGAKFIVQNEAGEYATFELNTNKEWAFTGWVTAEAEATDIVSDDNGVFNIIGLVDGTYYLIETQAPSNCYVQLKDEIEFEVEHGKYNESNLVTNVKNTPKGRLPLTGGPGILIFLAVGLALMISAVVWNKKTKKQAKV